MFYFGFSSDALLLPTGTSLHDLVTPLLGLLALASRESQAERGGLLGWRPGGSEARRGEQETEPVASLQGAKQSAEPLVSGVTQ